MHILIFISTVLGLSCYKCMGEDNLCSPGRLGEKVDCKPDVTHCLKTWTGSLRNMIWLIKLKFSKINKLYAMSKWQLLLFIHLVETSPKTKRSCGTSKYVGNKCKDLLFGANTMLYCPCNNTNYCNSAGHLQNLLQSFFPSHPYQSQPKVAFFALVLIFHAFHHHIASFTIQLYSWTITSKEQSTFSNEIYLNM